MAGTSTHGCQGVPGMLQIDRLILTHHDDGFAGTNVVFVGNLAWSTTEESLRTFASTIGPVLSVQIQTHADTGRSKGWG